MAGDGRGGACGVGGGGGGLGTQDFNVALMQTNCNNLMDDRYKNSL